jgi:hypothetical protein
MVSIRVMRQFCGLLLAKLASYLWKLEIAVQALSLTLRQEKGERASLGKDRFLGFEKVFFEIKSIEDLPEAIHKYGNMPVLVDCNKISTGYGYKLEEFHPLVMELRYPGFLEEYFRNFQPTDIQEAWFPIFPNKVGEIEETLVRDRKIPWLPWIISEGCLPTNDIAGSGYGHGSQFRGPITRINLHREQFRVHSLYKKFLVEGYRPERYGHISGQFLEKNGEWLFVVLGGHHRAAVLRALGYTKIPVLVSGGAQADIIRFELMRSSDEYFVFEALFNRDGQTVRNEFVKSCLQAHCR